MDRVTVAAEHGPILLVFDQFEELVTLFPRGPELSRQQEAVVDAIVTLLRGRPIRDAGAGRPTPDQLIPVKLLLSFRDDYLGVLKPLLERRPELIHQSLRLTAPPLSKAAEIIRAPFTAFPQVYAPDLSPLADRIAAALGDSDLTAETPLSELQIVCSRLYQADADPDAELRRGVKDLLEAHLQDQLGELADDERDAAIAILSQLVTASGTRNVVARDALLENARAEQPQLSEATVVAALEKLEAAAGLVRRELHSVQLYELTSDFLIDWISEQRHNLEAEQQKRAEEAARARAAHRAMVKRRRMALAAIVVVVIAVLAYAVYRAEAAANYSRQVGRSERLQLTAQGLLSSEPDAALVFALAAYGDISTPGARTTLTGALEQAALSPAEAVLNGFGSTVTGVAFDPTKADELASTNAGGAIRLWNTSHHLGPVSAVTGLPSGAFSAAFSANGRTLAVGFENGTVELYAIKSTGRIGAASAPIQVEPGIVTALAFSHDDRVLAAAGLDADVRLISLSRGRPQPRIRTLPGLTRVRSLGFAPTTDTLATVTDAGEIALWDGLTSRPVLNPDYIAGDALYAVSFDPVSRTPVVAFGGLDGNVYLWRAGSGRPSVIANMGGSSVDSISFSPDGRRLAVGGNGESIRIITLANDRTAAVLYGHEGVVTGLAFSPDGKTLASASTDQTVRLWPIRSQNLFGRAVSANVGRVAALAYASDGDYLAVGGVDGVGRASVSDRGLIGSIQPLWSASHANVRAVAVSPFDGDIAAATNGGQLRVWTASGKAIKAPIERYGRHIYTLAFDPVTPKLAVAGYDGQIRVLSYHSGQIHTFGHRTDQIFSLAYSHNGQILASAGDDRVIRLWHTQTGRQFGVLAGDSDAIFSVAFSSSGRWLASGSADDTVRLWDVADRRELGLPLWGHHNYVRSVAFDAKSRLLASGSLDGTIRVWNVGTGTPVGEPLSSDGQHIQTVAFSPNQANVIGSGDDGVIHVWPLITLGSYASERRKVCNLVGGGLSRTEWRQFAPQVPYQDPC